MRTLITGAIAALLVVGGTAHAAVTQEQARAQEQHAAQNPNADSMTKAGYTWFNKMMDNGVHNTQNRPVGPTAQTPKRQVGPTASNLKPRAIGPTDPKIKEGTEQRAAYHQGSGNQKAGKSSSKSSKKSSSGSSSSSGNSGIP